MEGIEMFILDIKHNGKSYNCIEIDKETGYIWEKKVWHRKARYFCLSSDKVNYFSEQAVHGLMKDMREQGLIGGNNG